MQTTTAVTNKKTQIKEYTSFIFTIFLALMIRFFVMELFFVPTGSMKATVLENDYIFSTKYSYGYSNYSFPFSPNIFNGRIWASQPQRGDIIVFRPPNNMDIRFIKRLIGLPGDKVQLINDVVYINDKAIERTEIGTYTSEEGKNYIKFKEILPNSVSYFSYKLKQNNHSLVNKYGNTEIFYVPEGKYFFLGDNRDESNDSRIDLGFVPFKNFIAKGQFIIFSTKAELWQSDIGIINQILRVGTWLASIRFNRIFTFLYTDKIQNDNK